MHKDEKLIRFKRFKQGLDEKEGVIPQHTIAKNMSVPHFWVYCIKYVSIIFASLFIGKSFLQKHLPRPPSVPKPGSKTYRKRQSSFYSSFCIFFNQRSDNALVYYYLEKICKNLMHESKIKVFQQFFMAKYFPSFGDLITWKIICRNVKGKRYLLLAVEYMASWFFQESSFQTQRKIFRKCYCLNLLTPHSMQISTQPESIDFLAAKQFQKRIWQVNLRQCKNN